MSKPVKSWKFGRVDVALWEFTNNGNKNYSFTIQKSYQDKDKKWQQTGYLAESDLKSLIFGLLSIMTTKYSGIREEKSPAPAKEPEFEQPSNNEQPPF